MPRVRLGKIELFCRIRNSASETVTSLNISVASFAGDKHLKLTLQVTISYLMVTVNFILVKVDFIQRGQ